MQAPCRHPHRCCSRIPNSWAAEKQFSAAGREMQPNCSAQATQDRPPPQNQSLLIINDASMLQKPSSQQPAEHCIVALAGEIWHDPSAKPPWDRGHVQHDLQSQSTLHKHWYASLIEGQSGFQFPVSWPRSIHPLRTAESPFSCTPPSSKY